MDLNPLSIRLFGAFEVCVGGEPMRSVRTRSVEWLLALLVLRHGREVSRSWLAGTLWPESREAQAFLNLRRNLMDLRRALGPEAARLLSPAHGSLRLDLTGAAVDVVDFDAALVAGDESSLERAVSVYRGPLLEGCVEEWLLPERASRAEGCLQALEALAEGAIERGDLRAAWSYLVQAEKLDPLRDSAQRRRMQVLAAGGDVPAALLSYREYRLQLHRELNLEPDPETTRLFQELRTRGRDGARGRRGGGATGRRGDNRAATVSEQKRREQEQEHEREHAGPAAGSPPRPLAPSPPRPVPPSPHPLPRPLTALVGREEGVREVARRVLASRLVTLIGGGGVGKTRLAIQAATEIAGGFPDGVVFCELASLADPALLPASLAAALGVARDEAMPEPQRLIQALTGWLTAHSVLLVLDNCEHLIEAAAALAHTLLEACPELKILATSRQRLGLTGEIAWRVPSLPVPGVQAFMRSGVQGRQGQPDFDFAGPEHLNAQDHRFAGYPPKGGWMPPERLMQYPAVQLFVERAAAVRPSFRLASREDAVAVAQICRRLDGIPLAIELAAARVTVLSLPQIAAGLDDRFRLLTGGSRAALPRQRTLQALIDWSYELLPVEERALLRRLSAFAGGWTLAAAEAVAALQGEGWRVKGVGSGKAESVGPDIPHPAPFTLDLLSALEEKSLVLGMEREAAFRYGMLETVREYARQKLWEAGEEEAARRQHLGFFLQLAEEARAALSGPGQKAALAVMEAELDNLRAALAWAQAGAPALHLRLAAALWPFWFSGGHLTEGRQQLRLALSRTDAKHGGPDLAASIRADALLGASRLAVTQHDLAEARAFGRESLELFRALDDTRGIAGALSCLGWVSLQSAESKAARSQLEEALAICRRFGYRAEMRTTVSHLTTLAHAADEREPARTLAEENLAVAQELGDEEAVAESLSTLGHLALKEGDAARARSLLEQSLAIERRLGHRPATAAALETLGKIARQQGEYAQSLDYFEEALGFWRELGNPSQIAWNLLETGNAAYAQGAYALARQSYEQSCAGFRRVNDWWGLRCASNNLGSALFRLGEVERARSLHREALLDYQRHGSSEGIAWTLGRLGVIEAGHGEARQAARLLGAASVAWEKAGTAAESRHEQAEMDQAQQLLRAVLGDPGLECAWAEGRAMSFDEAVAYALEGE